jgi:membrane fusion protein (multidrug efflux system)
MRLQFSVPATLLAFIKPGQSVEATTPAFEHGFPGTISALDSRVDPISRAITVRAVLDNPGQVLRPGLLMEVLIKGPPRQALLVPEESLESRSSSHYLWRVEGQTARRIEVGIGGRSPGWVEITGGLKPGDRVVRDGVGRLSGDQAVVAPVES